MTTASWLRASAAAAVSSPAVENRCAGSLAKALAITASIRADEDPGTLPLTAFKAGTSFAVISSE